MKKIIENNGLLNLVLTALIAILLIDRAPNFWTYQFNFWDGLFSFFATTDSTGKTSYSEVLRNLGLVSAAVVGLIFAKWRADIADRLAVTAQQQAETADRGHISERYSKAVELLGNDNSASVRIGGIYALKSIAEDSLERHHPAVMDVLTNFIRHPPYSKEQREGDLQAKENKDERSNDGIKDTMISSPVPKKPLRSYCPDVIAAIDTIQNRTVAQKNFDTNRNYTPSLESAQLKRLLLNGVDLSNLNLRHANLRSTYLNDSTFSDADLTDAELKFTRLKKADLSKATLTRASLTSADLSNAKLVNANLFMASLHKADLTDADLSNASLSFANLNKATLVNATLTGADLTGANLTGANLIFADLSNANLSRTVLEETDLTNANFADASLTSTKLMSANLTDAVFANASLMNADLTDTNLTDADFSGANLEKANLSDAYLGETMFSGTNLSGANFTNVKFFDDVDLSTAFTRKGRPLINLPDGIDPPPVRK